MANENPCLHEDWVCYEATGSTGYALCRTCEAEIPLVDALNITKRKADGLIRELENIITRGEKARGPLII